MKWKDKDSASVRCIILLPLLYTTGMLWYQIFADGVEYESRVGKPFVPPNITIKQVWEAVPKHLFAKSTTKSLYYIVRHLLVTYLLYLFAQNIDTILSTLLGGSTITTPLLKTVCWTAYWGFQGFAFAGIWCLGELTLSGCGMQVWLAGLLIGHDVGLVLDDESGLCTDIDHRQDMVPSQTTLSLTIYLDWRSIHSSWHHIMLGGLHTVPIMYVDFSFLALAMLENDLLESNPKCWAGRDVYAFHSQWF